MSVRRTIIPFVDQRPAVAGEAVGRGFEIDAAAHQRSTPLTEIAFFQQQSEDSTYLPPALDSDQSAPTGL